MTSHLDCTVQVPGQLTSNLAFDTLQAWGLQRLDVQACWQQGYTGLGAHIGHLDTGVDASHPALKGRVSEFMEFDEEGFSVPGAQPRDSGSHGTHIAGIICGNSIGVAPGAKLCSGMVIEGGKSLVRILAGLDWMLDCKIRVLCLSLGIPFYTPLYEILLNRVKRSGVLVIAPIGNRGSERTCSPANYPGVLAVGAINARDWVARFSGSQLCQAQPGRSGCGYPLRRPRWRDSSAQRDFHGSRACRWCCRHSFPGKAECRG
jgi:subtilisin family serine protease